MHNRMKLVLIRIPCSFEDGVKLVKIRGESMQAAADAQPSAMASVLKLDADQVKHSSLFGIFLACS